MTGSAPSGTGLCLMNDVCFKDGSKAEDEGSLPPSGAEISSHLSQGNIQRCLEAWGIEGVVVVGTTGLKGPGLRLNILVGSNINEELSGPKYQ